MDSTEPWSGPTLVVVCVCWTQTMSVYVCVCVCVCEFWEDVALPACTVVEKRFLSTVVNIGGAPEGCRATFRRRAEKTFNNKDKCVSVREREREREKERERECMCAAVYVWPCTAHTHDWGNELWVTSVMFAGRFENLEEVQCKIRLTHSNLWYWQPQRRQHAPPLFITHNYIRYHSLDLAGP